MTKVHWDDPCVVFDGRGLLIIHDMMEHEHEALAPCDHCAKKGWDENYWNAQWDKEETA